MKSRIFKTALIIIAVIALLGGFSAWAEEEKPTASADIGAFSKYVWRGEPLSNDSIVIQPSLTVGYKGFSVNAWANIDTELDDGDPATSDNGELTETDFTLAYDTSVGPWSLGLGYIYYALDGLDDSQELYVSVGYDVFLSPTLTVYKDIGTIPRWYINFGLSHSLELPNNMTLDLSGSAGYYVSKDEDFVEYDDSLNATNSKFSDLNDGVLSATLTIPINKYMTFAPMVAYSFPLSDAADNRGKYINSSTYKKNDSDFLYGGATLSISF